MCKFIEDILFQYGNLFVQASIDVDNYESEIEHLKKSYWTTVFFGDNTKIENRIKCPKNWVYKRGERVNICLNCNICFTHNRKDIHFKKH